MLSRPLGLVTLTCLVGCGSPDTDSSTGVVRDSAGVRVVELPSPADDGIVTELSIDPTWAPATGLEIGDLLDIAVLPGRGILLLDELAESVSFVSDAGELLAVIGREGEGPGEFNPQGLSQVIATDSSVFVPDLFMQRVTEFDLDGEVLGIKSFPFSPLYAVGWRRDGEGGLAFRAYEQFGDQIVQLVGGTADTILSVEISNDYPNLLLSPVTLWDLTADGDVLLARTDRAAVELRRRETGALLWRAQWAQPAKILDEAAVAHLEGLVRERILRDTPDIAAEQLAANLAALQFPERGPALAGLMVAPGGDVWVRWAKPVRAMDTGALLIGSAEAFGGRDWDVLDRGGRLKARVRLPEGFSPRRFSGDWMCGILSDDLGIETVARVEIRL